MNNKISFVYFDIGHTLFKVLTPPEKVYFSIARKYNPTLKESCHKLLPLFQYVTKEEYTQLQGRVNTHILKQRWKNIVTIFFQKSHWGKLCDECFQEIYNYYASPHVWEINTHLISYISKLYTQNIKLGILSNSDHRLKDMVSFYNLYAYFTVRIFSFQYGWEKPHKNIYTQAIDKSKTLPENILIVGDSYYNDYLAPKQHGLQAFLLCNNYQELYNIKTD